MAFGLHFVRSLKFKLVFTALSAVLVALAVEAVAAHWSGIRTISAVTKGNLTSMYNSAKSRVATFNEARWRDMAQLSSEAGLALEGRGGGDIDGLLRGNLTRIAYFNEIFVADAEWNIVASTDASAVGTKVGRRDAKRAVDDGADKYIDGPYVDEKTRELGASTSRFHDAVTLMYYAPIMRDGQRVGVVGARLPNDVLSDILQADESHI